MSTLDEFESMFRSAAKELFMLEPPPLRKVAIVTDTEGAPSEQFGGEVRRLLDGLLGRAPTFVDVTGPEYTSVGELIERLATHEADLVCTYRHLDSDGWQFGYGLGSYVDVLTQATEFPVLVAPHPSAARAADHAMSNTDNVMAITDHLAGSQRLVNTALAFTQTGGKLWLTHVEDEAAFDRIIEAISKIPTIDTQHAREAIAAQLLKEPHDYVSSCRQVLEAAQVDVSIEELVVMGHHLSAYRQLVGDHEVDLLVMNTKDDEQLAMHGMAYPLAVELRHVPLLLL